MDEIYIKLPAKPEYVSIARLTASAIATRLNFTMDDIEELKLSVSESINFLMNQFYKLDFIEVSFNLCEKNQLVIDLTAVRGQGLIINEEADTLNELSLFIIESIADRIDKNISQGRISIYKNCGGQS